MNHIYINPNYNLYKVVLIVILISFSFFFKVNAQQKPLLINGTITDSITNQPIQNAIILSGNTLLGKSNAEGKFSIQFTKEMPIDISCIGYKRLTIPFQNFNAGIIEVKLVPVITALNTVNISTGYQNLPKERATGSFTVLSNEQLNQQIGTNILARLEGIANGVAFDKGGQRPAISIRGLSSINAAQDPLIVLDNFPYAGNIENINPNDVDNITILKDAAATSIWGAKAGNGVIVITTKSGKFNQAVRVQVNGNINALELPNLSKAQDQMNAIDYITLEEFLFDKGYYSSALGNTSTFPVVSPIVEILDKRKRGLLTTAEAEQQMSALKQNDIRKDVVEHLYTKGINQQYGININGGTAKTSYTFFTGYDRNENHLAATYGRLAVRLQNNFKLTEKLTFSTGALFTQSENKLGKSDLHAIRSGQSQGLYPYARLVDENGIALPLIKTFRQAFKDTVGKGKLLDWNYYPLEDDNYLNRTNRVQDILGNLSVNYQLLKWINASVKYQYEKQQLNNKSQSDEGSFYVNSLINQFTQIDKAAGTVKYIVPRGSILGQSFGTLLSYNVRAQLNVDKAWDNFQLNGIVGTEQDEKKFDGSNSTTYGYNSELGITNGLIDPITRYPLIYGGTSTISNSPTFNGTLDRNVSYYTNTGLTFKKRYIFSASARKDMSNLFGVNTNQKGRPFWSAGVAWNLSEESFYKLSFLPYLKFSATYGYSGNVDNSLAAVTTIRYNPSGNSYTGYPQAIINNFENPDLRWEKSGILNLLLDFASFNKRISGSFEYYHKKGRDLLGEALLDITVGLKSTVLQKNVASMSGSGVDLALNTRNLVGNLKWTTNVILNLNENKIDKYHIKTYQGSTYVSARGTSITPIIGKPVYSILSFKWAGLNATNGNPQGYLNGEISEDYTSIAGTGTTVNDLVYHGSAIPIYFGALNNLFSYKNVSLNFNVTYKFGHYFRKSSISYSNLFSGWAQHIDYAKRWQKSGDESFTQVPSLVYPAINSRDNFYTGSEILVRKADHIRLQFINLSYSIAKDQLKSLPVNNLKLTMNIANVGILWAANKEKLDPEYAYSLTPPRSFSLGLQVNF